ncbi:Gar1 protein RNA binding region [Cooperia oncophora]
MMMVQVCLSEDEEEVEVEEVDVDSEKAADSEEAAWWPVIALLIKDPLKSGEFTHTCEDDIVLQMHLWQDSLLQCSVIFTKTKNRYGKIDEIFGSLMDNGFSVTLQNGVKAASFKEGQKLYIDPAKLMPIERFLPGAPRGGRGRGGRGGDRGRGGRGGDRGGG